MTEIYKNSVISEFPERERGALGEGGCVVRPLRQHGEVGGGPGLIRGEGLGATRCLAPRGILPCAPDVVADVFLCISYFPKN